MIDGDEVKSQAQAGKMGEQLYAVVYKQTVKTGTTKAGKDKLKIGPRLPCPPTRGRRLCPGRGRP